jgi:alkylmercury lyase
MTNAELVSAAAFRLLLDTGVPVQAERLAAEAALEPGEVEDALRELDARGRVCRDEAGSVVGAAGLSVVPTAHRIEIDGGVRWTWCAMDALGILAALGGGGRIESRSPGSGTPITVQFEDGAPLASDAVLLVPERREYRSLVEELCPLLNLFESRSAGEAWIERSGVPGVLRTLDDAAARYGDHWRGLLRGADAP